MKCTRCQQTLHPDGYYCHFCGQPTNAPAPMSGARTLACVLLATLSLPAIGVGGCFALLEQGWGILLAIVGVVGLVGVWKLAR